jgi:hypothetical protein
MKTNYLFYLILLTNHMVLGQDFSSLTKMKDIAHSVYFSSGVENRAKKIYADVEKADQFFQKEFKVTSNFTLLILSPKDWPNYAAKGAIYGIPHFTSNNLLIVASDNNMFWKRNIPPLELLPKSLADQMINIYSDENGELNLSKGFDLLAVHELAHAYQKSAGMIKQRLWQNELFANILLHAYLAQNAPEQIPNIGVFTKSILAATPQDKLKYTSLTDFETYYNDLGRNYPDNYGWYQSRFHLMAEEIYDDGGMELVRKLWDALLKQTKILDETELMNVLNSTHPALEKALRNWDNFNPPQ